MEWLGPWQYHDMLWMSGFVDVMFAHKGQVQTCNTEREYAQSDSAGGSSWIKSDNVKYLVKLK